MVGFLVIDSRIAARNLMRNKGRTLVSVLTVATGIIAFLLAGGFIEWVFESMREATIRWQLGHIQVVKPDYMKKGIADPYRFLLPEQSAEFETIRNAQSLRPSGMQRGSLAFHNDLLSAGWSATARRQLVSLVKALNQNERSP